VFLFVAAALFCFMLAMQHPPSVALLILWIMVVTLLVSLVVTGVISLRHHIIPVIRACVPWVRSILRTSVPMLVGGLIWFCFGLGYNALTNWEAVCYQWLPMRLDEKRSIDTAELTVYKRVRDVSVVVGLAVGLGVALARRREDEK